MGANKNNGILSFPGLEERLSIDNVIFLILLFVILFFFVLQLRLLIFIWAWCQIAGVGMNHLHFIIIFLMIIDGPSTICIIFIPIPNATSLICELAVLRLTLGLALITFSCILLIINSPCLSPLTFAIALALAFSFTFALWWVFALIWVQWQSLL